MTQNRSSAVMQQRHEAHDSLDDFPTPCWATRALLEQLSAIGVPLHEQSAWEPCCNRGWMVRALREYLASVRASDIERYPDWIHADAPELIDFATTGATEPIVDWVFANPPFRLAEEFIAAALRVARVGVAMLVRSSFSEGAERYRALFAPDRTPPSVEYVFSERVVMLKARMVRANDPDPFNLDPLTGLPKKASTATSSVWLVWLADQAGQETRKRWIPPCRLQLERDGDYPVYTMPAAAPATLGALL